MTKSIGIFFAESFKAVGEEVVVGGAVVAMAVVVEIIDLLNPQGQVDS